MSLSSVHIGRISSRLAQAVLLPSFGSTPDDVKGVCGGKDLVPRIAQCDQTYAGM